MPDQSTHLDAAALRRYNRQILLEEIGIEGQEKLARAKVLIVGAGGLGSPAALYLAAAGIGTIGIADIDHVEEHNLQRQLLHPTGSVGKPKVDSAIVHLQLDEHRRSRIKNLPRFHDFVRNIFCHRRKVLRGVLVRMAGGKQLPEAVEKIDQLFADFGFQRSIRAEAIDPDTFVRLEQAFASD